MMTVIGVDYSITSCKDLKCKEPKREDVATETRFFFFFSESCKEL